MANSIVFEDVPVSPRDEAPVGSGNHVVQAGECLSTIAEASGHFWQTLWNDPANAALKEARGNPNMLLPGDRVNVPPLRQKSVPVRTGALHRFRRKGVPAFLHLRLLWSGEPRANEAYKLDFGTGVLEGTTTADGCIDVALPRDAYAATLTVGVDETLQEIRLQLGTLPPVAVAAGVERRLANLGFAGGMRSAIEGFQARHGLTVDGALSDALRAKLVEVHGS